MSSKMLVMYSPQLLDHFEHPRNVGDVAGPDASVQLENPACGDILKLSARIVNGKIVEIRFRAKGCVPAMACASLITEMAQGRSLSELQRLEATDVAKGIGGLPAASGHASHLAIDAIRALIGKFQH